LLLLTRLPVLARSLQLPSLDNLVRNEKGAGKMVKQAGLQNSGSGVSKHRNRRQYLNRPSLFRQRIRRLVIIIGTSSLVVLCSSLIAFAYFYNHYSTLVEQRVRSGFWHARGGVYAAPHRLRVGSRATVDSIAKELERSGFVEDSAMGGGVFNGSFQRDGNKITIMPYHAAAGYAEATEITFSRDEISRIRTGSSDVDEYEVEPELLIGRTESKRADQQILEYKDIPERLRNAIIMAEDQRYFSHVGLDPKGIARAFIVNLRNGEAVQGGSTITQQLVKNTFLSPERSFSRKFAEAFLALALENNLSKEEIFTLYCNEIYLGQYGSTGIHGVAQAAEMYFQKDLADLTLNEAAAIAGMIKNPNLFGPHKDRDASRTRREYILDRMLESGFASAPEVAAARENELALAKPRSENPTLAPYFVDSAAQALESKNAGDYFNTNLNTRIYTTINMQMQRMAEKAVAEQMAKLDATHASSAKKLEVSIVAIDPQTGHVLAMVGGRSYADSQFNRATSALRQPGSTFKPFVYATAIERGYTPISTFADRPMEFLNASTRPYRPANFRNGYTMKKVTLKTALARSSNVVAVQTAFAAGIGQVAAKAREFGFQDVEPYPSIALGAMEVTPLQLAAAYASFANGGRRVEPAFVDRIVSGDERTVYVNEPDPDRVISERTAYMITDMLQAVVERGTARRAHGALGKDVVFAGKTGSSKDGWFVGYTPNLVTVAWIGFDDNADVRSTGGEIALPLWTAFMQDVVRTMPEYGGSIFAMPAGLTEIVVDPETGMAADTYCPQSERVVLPIHAASRIKCLLHQPEPEVLVASVDTGVEWAEPNSVTIPATTEAGPDEWPEVPTSTTYLEEAERSNPTEQSRPYMTRPARPALKRPDRERQPSELDG
jgi:penicillin-binding protein 1B